MHSGSVTAAATSQFASGHALGSVNGFYRQAQGLTLSSLGIGTYLGAMDQATDEGYRDAVLAAIAGGVNVIDTSLNYRHQRSERAIGLALAAADADFTREELLLCTKAGYLVPNALPAGLHAHDVAGNIHCMTPAFLRDQLDRSRLNLGVETIDVFYLHNPETQLEHIDRPAFDHRLRAAFETLEEAAAAGLIVWYGAATWSGFRQPLTAATALSLRRMEEIARTVAGEAHRFRFIQLPVNLAMPEAFTQRDPECVLDAAAELGITVIASAPLLQARLIRGLPDEIATAIPHLESHAQRALQFARSTPGVTTALTGMSQVPHVAENLMLQAVPPLSGAGYLAIFR